jgi:hypothetical protein
MTYGRDYDDAEWAANVAGLAERGVLTPDGALTAEGSTFKAELEDRTDRIALSAYRNLDDGQIERLLALLTPLARAVIATGDIPPMTPIGPIAAALEEPARS